jgi:hypothetical protein
MAKALGTLYRTGDKLLEKSDMLISPGLKKILTN